MEATVSFEKRGMDLLDQLPMLLRGTAFDKAMRAAAKPVVEKAKELAPQGNDADRKKRSKKQKASADWNVRLRSTITSKLSKRENGGTVVVGPSWPRGNKAHFDWGIRSFGKGREKVLWGKRTGEVVRNEIHWLKRAGDLAKEQAIAAFEEEVRRAIAELTNG